MFGLFATVPLPTTVTFNAYWLATKLAAMVWLAMTVDEGVARDRAHRRAVHQHVLPRGSRRSAMIVKPWLAPSFTTTAPDGRDRAVRARASP